MKDARLVKLADTLVNYSTQVQPGDKVLIEAKGDRPTNSSRKSSRKSPKPAVSPSITSTRRKSNGAGCWAPRKSN